MNNLFTCDRGTKCFLQLFLYSIYMHMAEHVNINGLYIAQCSLIFLNLKFTKTRSNEIFNFCKLRFKHARTCTYDFILNAYYLIQCTK